MECLKHIKKNVETCQIPCKGLYADVVKEMDYKQDEQPEINIAGYEEYKAGYGNDTEYKKEIIGKYILPY